MTDLHTLTQVAHDTYRAAFGSSMHNADLEAHLNRELSESRIRSMLTADHWIVAQQDQAICGFVQFGNLPSDYPFGETTDAELRRLYITPHQQNQGAGQHLLMLALEELAGRDVYLDVWSQNFGARRLYERYDFRVVGKRPFAVASGARTDHDLIMCRSGKSDTK